MRELRLLDETWRRQWMSQAITFDEAVEAAAELLDQTGVLSRNGKHTAQVFISLFLLQAFDQKDQDEIERIVRAADKDADYHDALCLVASDFIEHGEVIPEPLATFAAEVLHGGIEAPKRPRGPHPYQNYYRDIVICTAIARLVSLGLTATRNRISEPDSSCDAVSQALSSLGTGAPYTTVETIWRNRRSTGFFST